MKYAHHSLHGWNDMAFLLVTNISTSSSIWVSAFNEQVNYLLLDYLWLLFLQLSLLDRTGRIRLGFPWFREWFVSPFFLNCMPVDSVYKCLQPRISLQTFALASTLLNVATIYIFTQWELGRSDDNTISRILWWKLEPLLPCFVYTVLLLKTKKYIQTVMNDWGWLMCE